MNGAQDLGGMMGFGPVNPEPNEPVFHEAWEKRMFALEVAMRTTGPWNQDQIRHWREDIPPPRHMAMSYFELWLTGHEMALLKRGYASADEIAAGCSLVPPATLPRPVLKPEKVAATIANGGHFDRPPQASAAFAVGDRVRTRIFNPTGHTRLPRYARGKLGAIERVHGAHVYPDANAHGRGEDPQWLYGVTIDGRELWGEDADPRLSVTLDLFEPYLERL